MSISSTTTLKIFSLALFTTLVLTLAGCGDDDDGGGFDCGTTTITFDLAVSDCDDLTIENVAGGTAPYEYSIDGQTFGTTPEFTDLASGNYTVTVRDNNTCTGMAMIDITDNLELDAQGEAFSITAMATGGTAPYEYALDDGAFQTTASFDVADSTATYTLTVRDASGCIATDEVTPEEIKTFTDPADGQVYRVVRIGEQIWLGENYNFDTNDDMSWCYDDEVANCDVYGRLYTWGAATTIAPEGWRLGSEMDWESLAEAVGGIETGSTELQDGVFKALRGGQRNEAGDYSTLGTSGIYWSSTEENENNAILFGVTSSPNLLSTTQLKGFGFSVRFLKEN